MAAELASHVGPEDAGLTRGSLELPAQPVIDTMCLGCAESLGWDHNISDKRAGRAGQPVDVRFRHVTPSVPAYELVAKSMREAFSDCQAPIRHRDADRIE